MPRRVKIPTQEKGDLHLLLVEDWKDFESLRDTIFGNQFSIVPQDAVYHALHRYSRPIVSRLGIPPEGALRKIPRECWYSKKRSQERKCSLYDKHQCFVTSKNLPTCFEPEEPSEEVRRKAAEVISLWREGVYVVVIVPNGIH
jgi:hypothetical protein